MAWTPAKKILEATRIGTNLLGFIETNQVEAIEWAHGSALKPLARIENSAAEAMKANNAANSVVYPAIAESDYSDATTAETYTRGTCSVTFDIWVTGSDPDTVKAQAKSYNKAVKSMIQECPNATTFADTQARPNTSVLVGLEGSLEPIAMHENGHQFLQRVQIRASYQLEGED